MQEPLLFFEQWLADQDDCKAKAILRALVGETKAWLDARPEGPDGYPTLPANDVIAKVPGSKYKEGKPSNFLDWDRCVRAWMDAREANLREFAAARALPEIVLPRYAPGGGRGILGKLWFESRPLATEPEPAPAASAEQLAAARETGVREPENREPEDSGAANAAREGGMAPAGISYAVKPPEAMRLGLPARLLFRQGRMTRGSVRWWLLMTVLLGTLVTGFLMAYLIGMVGLHTKTPVTTSDLWLVVAFALGAWWLRRSLVVPWFRLMDDRILPADDLVAYSEPHGQVEVLRDGERRHLRFVCYSATCPVCGAEVHLAPGGEDFPGRVVGRCIEAPREHVFSFDRVSLKGEVLRAPPRPCMGAANTAFGFQHDQRNAIAGRVSR